MFGPGVFSTRCSEAARGKTVWKRLTGRELIPGKRGGGTSPPPFQNLSWAPLTCWHWCRWGRRWAACPGPHSAHSTWRLRPWDNLLAMEGVRLAPRPLESKSTVLGKRPSFGQPALGSLKRCVWGFLLFSILFKAPSFSSLHLFPAEAPPKEEAFLPCVQERACLASSRAKGKSGSSIRIIWSTSWSPGACVLLNTYGSEPPFGHFSMGGCNNSLPSESTCLSDW